MTNQEVSDPALPLVLELISKIHKIDSKRYSCNLKTENGKFNLEVVDNYNEFKQPIPNIAQRDSIPISSARAETTATRAENFDTRGTGRWDFCKEKRHETRIFDSRTKPRIIDSDSTRNFDFQNFNTKSKTTKRKSPSEKRHDKNRLSQYLTNKNSSRIKTIDNSCQTIHLETSDRLIQAAATLHDSQSQTTPHMFLQRLFHVRQTRTMASAGELRGPRVRHRLHLHLSLCDRVLPTQRILWNAFIANPHRSPAPS